MKRITIFVVVLVVIATMALLGVSCKEQPATTEETETVTEQTEEVTEETEAATEQTEETTGTEDVLFIGLSQDASNEPTTWRYEASVKYFDDWNAAGKTPKIEYVYLNAEGDMDKQISNIDSIITMNADVMLDDAVDTVGVIPALQRAREAGIKVAEVRGVDQSEVDVTVEISEEVLAEMAIKWWHDYLDNVKPDLNIKAGIIYGPASQTEQLKRVDILLEDLLANYPERFQVLATNYGDWDSAKSMAIMEDWLQSQPDMNCVITAAMLMTTPCVNAILAEGKNVEDWTFTTDNTDDATLEMIQKGQIDMTVEMDVVKMGQAQAQLLIDMGTGEYTGNHYVMPEETLFYITQENVADYIK